MPLYITLETALVAGLDHSENQWKSLLARPVPPWTLYIAKLLVVMAMTVLSTLVLLCGILIDGSVLARVQSAVVFGFPVPWVAIFQDTNPVYDRRRGGPSGAAGAPQLARLERQHDPRDRGAQQVGQ